MVRLAWRLARTPLVLGVSYVVLLSAVTAGLTTPGARTMTPFGTDADLTLGGRARIAPLTQRFVDRVLGTGPLGVSEARPAPSSLVLGRSEEDRGEVVDHALTNDDREDAYPIARLPFTARTTTTGAGREVAEPSCGPGVSQGSVWYRYRARTTERLLADTFNSNYHTSLAAYGVEKGSLRQLACDTDPAGNAQIVVPISAGRTYFFQIADVVRGGELVFHLARFGTISIESVSTSGQQADMASIHPSMSADGRYVAFISYSTNLTPEGAEGRCIPYDAYGPCPNIFLRDRVAGITRLASIALDGGQTNAESLSPHVSDDGRYVVFSSSASNIVDSDTNGVRDVFLRDMVTGRSERVSVTSAGEQAAPNTDPIYFATTTFFPGSVKPAMSADARYVAFQSDSPNLDHRDTNGTMDVFVRDRALGSTSLACLDHRDRPIPSGCWIEGISRNGRWLVFETFSRATADDTDNQVDVFVRDLQLGTTERASSAPGDSAPNASAVSGYPVPQRSISDDGRFVVFGSRASNLVPGDANGAIDVFVRDRTNETTERVSVSSTGRQGSAVHFRRFQGGTAYPTWSISGDGRHVVFSSNLSGLVPDDDDQGNDVFLHDRSTKTTIRVSFAGQGSESEEPSDSPRVSRDGTVVVFDSQLRLTGEEGKAGTYVFSYQMGPR